MAGIAKQVRFMCIKLYIVHVYRMQMVTRMNECYSLCRTMEKFLKSVHYPCVYVVFIYKTIKVCIVGCSVSEWMDVMLHLHILNRGLLQLTNSLTLLCEILAVPKTKLKCLLYNIY